MTDKTQTIDYDLIFQELLKGRRTFDEVQETTAPPSLASYLEEYSTFWIGTSRQRGKTAYARRLLEETVQSAMITKDTGLVHAQQQALEKLGLHRLVLTAGDAIKDLKDTNAPKRDFRLVIVDEAHYTLATCRRKELYQWIASNGSEDTVVVMLTT